MKHTLIVSIALISATLGMSARDISSTSSNILPPASVAEQLRLEGGPGIVISGSANADQLPPAATQFIKQDYQSAAITNITHNYIKDTYNVTLSNGTHIEFNSSGKVNNIEAADKQTLPLEVLADILPQPTSIHLAESGLINMVNSVKNVSGKGTLVMVLDTPMPRMLFDIDGTFVITYY